MISRGGKPAIRIFQEGRSQRSLDSSFVLRALEDKQYRALLSVLEGVPIVEPQICSSNTWIHFREGAAIQDGVQ